MASPAKRRRARRARKQSAIQREAAKFRSKCAPNTEILRPTAKLPELKTVGANVKRAEIAHEPPRPRERLVSVAIRRDGKLHHGFKSHWELRANVDPENPDPYKKVLGDIEGFYTSKDRFVGRMEAIDIAIMAGQLDAPMGRELLSSDVNW